MNRRYRRTAQLHFFIGAAQRPVFASARTLLARRSLPYRSFLACAVPIGADRVSPSKPLAEVVLQASFTFEPQIAAVSTLLYARDRRLSGERRSIAVLSCVPRAYQLPACRAAAMPAACPIVIDSVIVDMAGIEAAGNGTAVVDATAVHFAAIDFDAGNLPAVDSAAVEGAAGEETAAEETAADTVAADHAAVGPTAIGPTAIDSVIRRNDAIALQKQKRLGEIFAKPDLNLSGCGGRI
jgi:hypothetical protein